ncbi:MAG: flagellar motor stator protein MotA [Bdellovibrionaceae bacterium]|nr:flagellar motor stator protein MotA [Pseudobdellovibrionaceae bacterium]|tara:strand:+ start:117732 stop:118592 length:861 start_codon:yes stop_codon:yes gene_type:complete
MGIVGAIVVLFCVFGGFVFAGGHLHVIWQPFEVLIIGGAALGGFIIANPIPRITLTMKMATKAIFGKPYNKQAYVELLQMMFRLFQIFRKDGPQAVEKHIEEPQSSEIFKAYPSFMKNHHAVDFLCDTMKITLSADLSQYDVDDLLDVDIKSAHEEEHGAQHAVASVGDSLPGLGIVAAVLGIVHTMDYLDQGVQTIGGLVAAALVGTFLGVLACYGFVAPLASKMGADIENEGRYMQVIKAALVALQRGAPPLVCVEFARRTIYPGERPTFEEMDAASKETKAAA